MKNILSLVACLCVLVVSAIAPTASAQLKIEGVWKIAEWGRNGSMNKSQPGFWFFTKSHYAHVGSAADKPLELPAQDATDAQIAAVWRSLRAAAGTYDLKGNLLTLRPEADRGPVRPGFYTTYEVKVEGNTLVATAKYRDNGPIQNPWTLKSNPIASERREYEKAVADRYDDCSVRCCSGSNRGGSR